MFINVADIFTEEIINLNNVVNISKEDEPGCMHEIVFHTNVDTEIRFSWRIQKERDEAYRSILEDLRSNIL